MRCKKITSYLNAYTDGELPEKQRSIVEAHLESCKVCQARLDDIHKIGELFRGSLPVPPVPDGLAARITAEARKRKSVYRIKRPSASPSWNPFRWIYAFSWPMRIAVCATVFIAMIAGTFIDGKWVFEQNLNIKAEDNFYGMEWFNPVPPGSIGSIYIAITDQTHRKGNKR